MINIFDGEENIDTEENDDTKEADIKNKDNSDHYIEIFESEKNNNDWMTIPKRLVSQKTAKKQE